MNQQELVDTLRQRHDLTWHQSTVTKIESGSRPVRLSEALAVADVLGVELSSLVDRPHGGDEAQRQRAIEFHARLSQIAEIKRDFDRDMSKRERQLQGFLDQEKW